MARGHPAGGVPNLGAADHRLGSAPDLGALEPHSAATVPKTRFRHLVRFLQEIAPFHDEVTFLAW